MMNDKIKKKFYTNGVKTIKLPVGELPPDGYYPGRTFNVNPWNKGLTKETDERVKLNVEKSTKTRNEHHYPAWNKGLTMENDERVYKNVMSTRNTIKEKYGVENISQYLSKQDDYVIWNKGLTKETNDSVKKISCSNIGKVV